MDHANTFGRVLLDRRVLTPVLALALLLATLLAVAAPALAQEEGGGEPVSATGDEGTEREATLSFELVVGGGPPAATKFFGVVPAEGCISVPLTDPEGDGLYTGSTNVPKFAPGGPPEPVSLPVQIVQVDGGGMGPCNPTKVIKDFGTVKLDGDKTFSASVSFDSEEPDPQEVSATGRIVEIADYPGASHALIDEAPGGRYLLTSDSVDLQDYAVSGERVIVYGTPVSKQYTTDTILNVTRVEPAADSREEVSATGALKRLEAEPVVVDGKQICALSTHAITGEATGQNYDLKSHTVDLNYYVGQRVSIYGESLPSPDIGGAGAERCPDLDVTRIERAGGPPPDNGGTDNGGSDNSGSGSSGGSSGGGNIANQIRGLLPNTGGLPLAVLGAGLLLIAGGLLVRKVLR